MASDDPNPSSILRSPSSPVPAPTHARVRRPPARQRHPARVQWRRRRAEVKIVVPAGEPPPAAMKVVLFDSFASGAARAGRCCCSRLLLFSIGLRNNRISGVPLAWAWLFFADFLRCAGAAGRVGALRHVARRHPHRPRADDRPGRDADPPADRNRRPVRRRELRFSARQARRDRRSAAACSATTATCPRRVLHVSLALRDGRSILVLPGRGMRASCNGLPRRCGG